MTEEQSETGAMITRSGYVAIVGRPNVGKSTLLNHILGQKISITSRKPQTTRHQILGVKTEADVQVMYVDTPGMHKRNDQALNRYMNHAAFSALRDVDLIVFVVDRTGWTAEDDLVLERIRMADAPTILAINKTDLQSDKTQLLPHIEAVSAEFPFVEIVPISAKSGENVDRLEQLIAARLPAGIQYFPGDQVTDRSSRFLAAEIVREKITRRLGDEIPYQVTVEIEEFKQVDKILHINALVWVERSGQKKIIIGQGGEQLKIIGRDARLDMEKLFDSKVMLRVWIKVKRGWSDNERAIKSLGYNQD